MSKSYIKKTGKVLILLSVFALLIPSLGCQVASDMANPDTYIIENVTEKSEPWERNVRPKKAKAKDKTIKDKL